MDIKPFEELKVTTMTLVMALSGNVVIDASFMLLPITRIVLDQTRKTSKCKLPHHNIPGSIMSMRFRGNTRGIVRNTSSPFKNAVTIDISTVKKNISLKLSSQSIQMCGASSRDDGVEAATHVLNHLYYTQSLLNRMNASPEITHEMINWIKVNTIGDADIRPLITDIVCGAITLKVKKSQPENRIAFAGIETPDHFDPEIFTFLASMADDFLYHSDFSAKLDYISTLKNVMLGDVTIGQVDVLADVANVSDGVAITEIGEVMVNYNYPLGFQVDRTALNRLINGRSGFVSRYQNALANCVTVELPYTPSDETKMKRRKNKIPHHTFLVYRSGSITQSGPGGEIMRDAYYSFMNLISELKPQIEYIVPE